MNKHNTIQGQMLEAISGSHFEKQAKARKTEFGAKGLRSRAQFVTTLFSRISGRHGLRGMEQSMNNRRNGRRHTGITNTEREIKRSALSYAGNHRDSNLFKAVFEKLPGEAQSIKSVRGFRFGNPLYSIASAVIDLCLKLFPRAGFRKGKGGIKPAAKPDHQGKPPCFAAVSNARGHDIKKIKGVPYKAGGALVFDCGFTDYGYFAALCEEKAWFVARLKKNAVYKRVGKRAAKEGGV